MIYRTNSGSRMIAESEYRKLVEERDALRAENARLHDALAQSAAGEVDAVKDAQEYVLRLEADKRQACRLLRAALDENPDWYSDNAVEVKMFLHVHEEAQP